MAKPKSKRKDNSINPQSPAEVQSQGDMELQAPPIFPPEPVRPAEEPGILETPEGEVKGAIAEKSEGPDTVGQEVPPGQEPRSGAPLLEQLMANQSFRKLVISRLIKKLR